MTKYPTEGFERTLVIIKPDALQRRLVGEVIQRFERKGLKIIGLKMLRISEEMAREHYKVHLSPSGTMENTRESRSTNRWSGT